MKTYYEVKQEKIKNFTENIILYQEHPEIIDNENFIFAYDEFLKEMKRYNDELKENEKLSNDIVKIENILQDKNYHITAEDLNETLTNLKSYQKKLIKLELEMKQKKNSKIVNLLTNILIILKQIIETLTTWLKNLRFDMAEFMIGKEHVNRIEPTEHFDLTELEALKGNISNTQLMILAVENFNFFLKENYYDAIPKNLYKLVDNQAAKNNPADETMDFELESLKFWPINIRQKILTNLRSHLESWVAKDDKYSLQNYQQINAMINDELNTIANLSIKNENLNEKIAEIEDFIKNSDQEIFESVRYLQYLTDLALIQEHHITEVYKYLMIPEKDELIKKITEMTQILENKKSITEQYELLTNYITFIPALNIDLEDFKSFDLATINNICQQILKTPAKDLMIEKLINHLETCYWNNLKEFIINYQKTQTFILQNLLIKIKMGETNNINRFAIESQFNILQKNEDKLLESIILCNKNYTNLIHLIIPNDQKKCENIIAKLAITTQSIEDHTSQIIPIYDQTNPPKWIKKFNEFDNKLEELIEQQNFFEDKNKLIQKKNSSQKQSKYRYAFYKERSLPQKFFKEFDILNANQLSFHHWYQTGYSIIDNFIKNDSLDKNDISFKEKEDELLTLRLSNLKKPAFYTTLIENLEAEQRTLLKDYPDLEQFLQNMFKNNEEHIATTNAFYKDFLVSKASTLENNDDDSKNKWYQYHYLLKSKYNHEFMRLFNYFGPKIYLLKFTNGDFAKKILQKIKTDISYFEIDFLKAVGLINNETPTINPRNLIIKNLDKITKHNESATFEMSSTSLQNKLPSYDIIQKYYECTNKINSLSYLRYFAELYDTNNPDGIFKKDNFSNSFMIPYEILHQIKSEIFDVQNEKIQDSIFKNKGHEIIEKIRFIQQKIISKKETIYEIILKNKTEIENDEQYSFDRIIIEILKDINAIFYEITNTVIKNHDKLNLKINEFNNDNAILNHLGKTIGFENIDTIPYHNLLIDWNKIDMHLEAFNLESLNSNGQKYIASNLLDTIQILIDELISNNLKLEKLDDDQIASKGEMSLFSDINSLVQLFCKKNAQQIFGLIAKLNENNNELNILLNKKLEVVIEKYKKEVEIGTDKLKELEKELQIQQKNHQEILQESNEQYQNEITKLKAELEKEKREIEKELQIQQKNHQETLQKSNEEHENKIRELEKELQIQQKKRHEALQKSNKEHQNEITKLTAELELQKEELEIQQTIYQKTLQESNKEHQNEITKLTAELELQKEELEIQQTIYQKTLQESNKEHQNEITKLKAELELEKRKLEKELQIQQKKRQEALQKSNEQHQNEITKLKAELELEKRKLEKELQIQQKKRQEILQESNEQHQNEITKLKAELELEKRKLEKELQIQQKKRQEILQESNEQHQNEITKLKAELEKEKIIHQEALQKSNEEHEKIRELEEKLELEKNYEVMKNFIDNLETIASNKDSLFKAVLNFDGTGTFNHTQTIMLESVWNYMNNKIEKNKEIDKEILIQKIAKLEQEISDLRTNVISSDIKDDFIENYLKELESWKIEQKWKTKTDFHDEYVKYKKEFKNKKIDGFKAWAQLIISTKNIDLHNKINDDETINKIIKYALLTIIKACEPYSNVLDQVGKKSTQDWENDKNKPVIIQDTTDINLKLNSTPLFKEYQSFNDSQEIIKNLITAGKYQLLKEIGKMLNQNMLNVLNPSSQIEKKLSLKVMQILNNIKDYKVNASKLNKNLSGSLSSLASTSTTASNISNRFRSWLSNNDSNNR
ncbi:hypothetical protein [Spiroplasma sp. DGKH1]|uniref:hypothetical protein n=1 Tax=Spiroplasma sp. DGKH1 TaxID=3050074 RepID=UPI0034C5FC91